MTDYHLSAKPTNGEFHKNATDEEVSDSCKGGSLLLIEEYVQFNY